MAGLVQILEPDPGIDMPGPTIVATGFSTGPVSGKLRNTKPNGDIEWHTGVPVPLMSWPLWGLQFDGGVDPSAHNGAWLRVRLIADSTKFDEVYFTVTSVEHYSFVRIESPKPGQQITPGAVEAKGTARGTGHDQLVGVLIHKTTRTTRFATSAEWNAPSEKWVMAFHGPELPHGDYRLMVFVRETGASALTDFQVG
jgi:hypothetical protein